MIVGQERVFADQMCLEINILYHYWCVFINEYFHYLEFFKFTV